MTIKELIAGRKSPEGPTHFGKGQVVSEKELRRPSFSIGFDLPAAPDYEALTTTYVAELHVMKQDAIGEMGLMNKGAAK